MTTLEDIRKTLVIMAELHGREFTPAAGKLLVADLAEYPPDRVIAALARCRQEVRGFPLLADIIARIDDGRPGPEESWAMVPKDEDDSAVMSQEMTEALRFVRPMVERDLVAARMAYVEKYRTLVAQARAIRKPARWTVSLGHDPGSRQTALQHGVERGYLSAPEAAALLPDFTPRPIDVKKLAGPSEEKLETGKISAILDGLLAKAPAHIQAGIEVRRQELKGSREMTTEEVEEKKWELRRQAQDLKDRGDA